MRQNNKAKGGDMEQMNRLLGDGGMMDDSGEKVNGVEVPVGSLKEEVADDIPAQLSEGEFVVPADVVRFIGLEKLMQLRDKAKQGLLRMEEMGQMGNAQEVEDPDQSFMQDDEDFGSEIDDIMAEDEPAGFKTGGFITGSDISRVPSNPAVAVGYYKHSDGRMMWITKINGKPMSAPPDGFNEVSAEEFQSVGKKADEAAAKVVAKPSTYTGMTGASGQSDGPVGGDGDGSSSSSSTAGPNALGNTALGLADAAEALSGMPSVAAQLGGAAVNALSQAQANASFGRADVANAAMQQANSMPGMVSSVNPDGAVTTVSSPATVGLSDAATFGAIGTSIGLGDAAEAANTGMTSVDGVTVSNDATIAVQDAATFGSNPYGGSPVGPAATPSAPDIGSSGDGNVGGPGGNAGGDSYICTASYNQAMITPSHFRSLKGYGARLRNNDPYLMRAYDSFGPKLASFVGKNKAADTTAAFLTNYYRAVQTKSSLTATQKAFSIMSDYVLRPAYRIMGWVLVKFVDKK